MGKNVFINNYVFLIEKKIRKIPMILHIENHFESQILSISDKLPTFEYTKYRGFLGVY